jgi:rSAM/selenodomain-associated transferase 2/rSAM/selenodomain-associated transferase 1
MHSQPRLIVFARVARPGQVKTRLIPALGSEGAAALHRRLVLRTLRTARSVSRCAHGVKNEWRMLEVHVAPDMDQANSFRAEDAVLGPLQAWLGDDWGFRLQTAGDLGRRMAQAMADSFAEGASATVIIGSDCPTLTPEILHSAFELLRTSPVVLGPAQDGGYYLVGLRQPLPDLFRGIDWGTASVLTQSLQILERLRIRPALLPILADVDRPGDLDAWNRLLEQEEADLRRISVIIPALNEELHLPETLQSVRQGLPMEILVVDGGSRDRTVAVAQAGGAIVIESKPGRARQMNAGAARASGNTLLFLHADTLLPADWSAPVEAVLRHKEVAAGAFAFALTKRFTGSRWVEGMTNLRSRRLQIPYGDQGLFLRRGLFEELGGFADLPIMEDYEFNHRLRRRGRIVTADTAIMTSGRRWQKVGVIRTTLINQLMIAGFHLGVSPARLAQFYRRT